MLQGKNPIHERHIGPTRAASLAMPFFHRYWDGNPAEDQIVKTQARQDRHFEAFEWSAMKPGLCNEKV